MPYRYCASCHNELIVDSPHLGNKVQCPYCFQLFVPAYKHSGLGITACLIGGFVILLELAIAIWFIVNPSWESESLTPQRVAGVLRLVRGLGFPISWIGIACAGVAYQQKRRNPLLAKWGVILCLLPTVFFMGYACVRPFLPRGVESEKEEVPMEEKHEEGWRRGPGWFPWRPEAALG